LNKDLADEMLKNIKNIRKIEVIKTYFHYGALGCKFICVVTTISFPPSSIITVPLAIGLTIADKFVLKSTETAIRKIKGLKVKFNEEDVANLS